MIRSKGSLAVENGLPNHAEHSHHWFIVQFINQRNFASVCVSQSNGAITLVIKNNKTSIFYLNC